MPTFSSEEPEYEEVLDKLLDVLGVEDPVIFDNVCDYLSRLYK